MFLELDNQDFNLYSNPQPLFQDWGNSIRSEAYYNPNYVFIPPFMSFPVKDFIGVPEFSQYTQFRVEVLQPSNYIVSPTALTGMSANPHVLTENGTTFSQTPTMQNLGLIPDGTYLHQYTFIVTGLSNGSWTQLSVHNYYLRLIKTSTSIVWSPPNFAITHQQGLPFQWHEINIDGPSWKLATNSRIILDSDDVDVTIVELIGSLGWQASGSGAKVVKFKLSNYYDTGTPDPSTLNQIINVLLGNNSQAGFINVNINILVNGFIYSDITNMHFEGFKGILEPEKQFVGVSAAIEPIEIEKSPWLIVEASTSQSGVFPFQNGFDIKPIATSNMTPGFYTGFVRFYVNNDDDTYFPIGEYSRTVTVTYQLFGDIVSPYDNNHIALTLTPDFYQFFAQLHNTYFDMTLKLKVFDFQNNETLKQVNLKVALFEQKALEYLGKLVHRLMTTPHLTNSLSCKPAELIIDVSEKNVLTHEVVRSFTSTSQKFIAGFNEKRLGNVFLKSQFLNINRKAKRVYDNQYYYLSWYQEPTDETFYETKKNGEDIFIGFLNVNQETVNCKSFKVNANQADVFELKIYQNPENLPVEDLFFEVEQIETLICFPPPKHWHDIVWVDEFKLLKNFIFGGEFTIESEKEFIQNRKYNGIFEALENIDVTNIKKLIINTGWMLKTDTETIDSLMNSEKVDLIKSYWNNGIIQESIGLTPISKKIINENSTDMTIEMTVEFEITPSR